MASEIEPTTAALEEAERFIAHAAGGDLAEPIGRVARLIEGFQSPYGMELLATVHWVAKQEAAQGPDEAYEAVRTWNERKRQLMHAEHVTAAWQRLVHEGWLRERAAMAG